MKHIGTEQRRRALADRHRLLPTRRTNDVVAITNDLVALHSSDPSTVFLSVFARMNDPAASALERALYDERTLLRFHAMRRTIWVARPEMVEAMNASSTRKIATRERAQLMKWLAATPGVDDAESELAALQQRLVELLDAKGPLTTREIGFHDPEMARKITVGSGRYTQQVGAHTRVGALGGFEAWLVRGRPSGTWITSEYRWHRMQTWSTIDFDAMSETDGAALVLGAWLDRFGPGTETDLRWWTGWTAAAVRRALSDLEAVEVSLDGDQSGWLLPDDPLLDEAGGSTEPWAAVLPSLDPTTMGWKERGWYLDDALVPRLFDRNGNAGPTIWCNGRIVGGWAQAASGELAFELLTTLSADEGNLVNEELTRMREAIGDIGVRVRFPSPNQKELLGE